MLADAHRNSLIPTLKRSFWLVSSIGGLLFLGFGAYLAWQELTKHPWSIDYRYLIGSLPIYWIALMTVIVNWNWIMTSLGATVGFKRNMKLYCLTNISKQLPSIIWFVGSRLLMYEREGVPKSLTSTGVVLELVLLTFSNVIVCLLVLPALPALQLAQRGLMLVLLVPLLLIMLRPAILIRLINSLLRRFGRNPLVIPLRSHDLVIWSMLYSVTWGLGGVFLYLLVLAISPVMTPHPLQIIGAWALSNLVNKLRLILPIGIGWSEVSLAYLLSFFMPLPSAVIITVVSRIWLALNEASWFLISLGL